MKLIILTVLSLVFFTVLFYGIVHSEYNDSEVSRYKKFKLALVGGVFSTLLFLLTVAVVSVL